ncbi:hypothetical protein [Herbaspirillum seropedicae]|uniref:hypothetical protein n=1 Tax=Herbaspirillum seropedicae TaxID=964 RepID=UPI003FCC95A2
MLDTFWMGCWRRLVDVGQYGRLPVPIATAVPRLHGDRRSMLGRRQQPDENQGLEAPLRHPSGGNRADIPARKAIGMRSNSVTLTFQ